MKVISLNANGLRSAVNKGLADWLITQNADVVCLQEIRIQDHQIPDAIAQLSGYHQYYFPAEKKGYSGVAILSKYPALSLQQGLGWPCADLEGRYLAIDIGPVTIASCYLPSGSSSPERQAHKFEFMAKLSPVLAKILSGGQPHILCGDWNIAHTKIDIKNWQSNQKNSGFLPEERQWLSDTLQRHALLDAYRYLYPEQIEYSWWSNRANAYANNVGWRIDYQLVSQSLASSLLSLSMPRQPKFSDHAPLIGEYAISLT